MIEDLSSHVDSTQSRLTKVTRTLNDFIRKNEGEPPATNRTDPRLP